MTYAKAPTPNSITLGIRISTYKSEKVEMDLNIQPIETSNLPEDTMVKFLDWRERIDGIMERD